MKFTTAIGTLLFMAGLCSAATSKCNADACARAVTGTGKRFPTQLHDCSSYQACTLTPAATVITSTTTVTPDPSTVTVDSEGTTTTVQAAEKLRRVRRQGEAGEGGWNTGPVTSCPTATPDYASACSGTVRYSSACGCMGVTKSIFSTAQTPTYTTTATVYADVSTVTVTGTSGSSTTTTSTPAPQPPGGGVAGLFKLQIRGGQYEGQYLVPDGRSDFLVPVASIPTPPSDGDGFSGMFSLVEQGEARSFGDLTTPYYNKFTWYSDDYYGSPVLTRQFSNSAKKFRCHVDDASYLQCNNGPLGNLNSYWNLTAFRICQDNGGPRLYINRKENANDRCWSSPDIGLKVMWKQ